MGIPTRPSGMPCSQHSLTNAAAIGPCRCFDLPEERHGKPRNLRRKESAPPAGPESLLSLKKLSAYSDISVRTLGSFLKDPIDPMPHYRPRGKIYVRLGEFNDWMAKRRCGVTSRQDLERLVAETAAGLRKTST
jgi:hypothetical protein